MTPTASHARRRRSATTSKAKSSDPYRRTHPPQAKCYNLQGQVTMLPNTAQTSILAESQGIHGLIATYTGVEHSERHRTRECTAAHLWIWPGSPANLPDQAYMVGLQVWPNPAGDAFTSRPRIGHGHRYGTAGCLRPMTAFLSRFSQRTFVGRAQGHVGAAGGGMRMAAVGGVASHARLDQGQSVPKTPRNSSKSVVPISPSRSKSAWHVMTQYPRSASQCVPGPQSVSTSR